MGAFISGVFTGVAIFYLMYIFSRGRKEEKKEVRRGLYEESYTIASDSTDFVATFEIAEIESTDTKTKVKVISVNTTDSAYNIVGSNDHNILKMMVDNSWVLTEEISWITNQLLK